MPAVRGGSRGLACAEEEGGASRRVDDHRSIGREEARWEGNETERKDLDGLLGDAGEGNDLLPSSINTQVMGKEWWDGCILRTALWTLWKVPFQRCKRCVAVNRALYVTSSSSSSVSDGVSATSRRRAYSGARRRPSAS